MPNKPRGLSRVLYMPEMGVNYRFGQSRPQPDIGSK